MAVQFRDYYKTLGVSKTATQDEIKSAFRKLARKFHPDTAEDKKTAEEKFKEINEAYEVLGDPEKRRKYDEYGANWEHAGKGGMGGFPGGRGGTPGGGYGGGGNGGYDFGEGVEFEFGGTGFSDFFEQMFGARRAGRAGGAGFGAGIPQRGSDVEADIMVTLEEAFHGSTRQISFRRGESQQVQTYTVKIPKGVREGQRIRLAGQGGAGASGAGAGDLFLRVKIQKHPYFEVEGSDLRVEVEVPVWTCALGGDLEVQTLEGRAKLHLPEGTQNGRKMRLAGRGFPKPEGGRGDLYVKIVVELPVAVTPEAREHWEALKRIAGSGGAG